MIADVERFFDRRLTDKFKTQPDVLSFLIRHERKRICLNELCRQIEIAERKQLKLQPDVHEYKQLIGDIALMFASACLKKAEEDHLSSIEKIRRRHEYETLERSKEIIHELEKDGVVKNVAEPGEEIFS